MYSLVLMAAVSGSPDVAGADTPVAVVAAPVSYGCSGVVSSGYGCSASHAGYGSCYGRSFGCGMSVAMPAYRYGGCYGSSCHGGSCMGTVASYGCGGGYGSSCHGTVAYAGFSGCYGSTAAAPAKHGFLGIVDRLRARRAGSSASTGCMGSGCYGSVAYGGCYGSSCHGTVAYSHGYSGGCYGSHYSGAVWGAATPAYTTVVGEKVIGEKVMPGAGTGTTDTTDKKGAEDKKGTGTEKKGNNEEGANIKFQLPATAKLYVDGRLTSGEGTERAFFTPPLAAGQKFFYDVKAEVVVDGKTITEEKRVIVQAGADTRESFPKLLAAAGNPASVASK